MNVQDVFSGAWGSSTAVTIMGAFLIFFIKRSLMKYDAHIEKQYEKINKLHENQAKKNEEIKDSINDMRVKMSIVSTQVEGLTKSIDKINSKGCYVHKKNGHEARL